MNERIAVGVLTLVIVGGLALGCQAGLSDAPGTPARSPSPEPTTPPPPDTPGVAVPAGAEKVVALARADLARRLKTEEVIAVAGVEAVDWPSTALGCPAPGMVYIQIITPGYRVTLTAGGQRYEYHTNQGTEAVLCQDGTRVSTAPLPTVVVTDPRASRAVETARADLAQRLKVDPAIIAVVQVYAGEFPAQGLGCWPPGTQDPAPARPALVSGFEIVLRVGERDYVYRAHGSMVAYCGPW